MEEAEQKKWNWQLPADKIPSHIFTLAILAGATDDCILAIISTNTTKVFTTVITKESLGSCCLEYATNFIFSHVRAKALIMTEIP